MFIMSCACCNYLPLTPFQFPSDSSSFFCLLSLECSNARHAIFGKKYMDVCMWGVAVIIIIIIIMFLSLLTESPVLAEYQEIWVPQGAWASRQENRSSCESLEEGAEVPGESLLHGHSFSALPTPDGSSSMACRNPWSASARLPASGEL